MYYVVEEAELGNLLTEVNNLINLGWKCQGGIAIVKYTVTGLYTVHTIYAQAMVKE